MKKNLRTIIWVTAGMFLLAVVSCKKFIKEELVTTLNEDYYKAGTVTLTDLLDAQSFLQQTRDRYTESITVYRLKRSNYLQVTGRY